LLKNGDVEVDFLGRQRDRSAQNLTGMKLAIGQRVANDLFQLALRGEIDVLPGTGRPPFLTAASFIKPPYTCAGARIQV